MFDQFHLGFAVLASIVLILLYLVARQIRKIAAWALRDDDRKPRERAVVFALFLGISAFVIGGISGHTVSEIIDGVAFCHNQQNLNIKCLMDQSL